MKPTARKYLDLLAFSSLFIYVFLFILIVMSKILKFDNLLTQIFVNPDIKSGSVIIIRMLIGLPFIVFYFWVLKIWVYHKKRKFIELIFLFFFNILYSYILYFSKLRSNN